MLRMLHLTIFFKLNVREDSHYYIFESWKGSITTNKFWVYFVQTCTEVWCRKISPGAACHYQNAQQRESTPLCFFLCVCVRVLIVGKLLHLVRKKIVPCSVVLLQSFCYESLILLMLISNKTREKDTFCFIFISIMQQTYIWKDTLETISSSLTN